MEQKLQVGVGLESLRLWVQDLGIFGFRFRIVRFGIKGVEFMVRP